MKIQWTLKSILGLVLTVLALVSLLFVFAGIIEAWVLREPVTREVVHGLDLLDSTLDTTSEGLRVTKTSLKSVTATLNTLQLTVASAATTVGDASDSVNTLSTVVGKNLSGTVNSALSALDTVETTTKTIDGLLAGLASLPLLNLTYDPATPLSASIGDLTEQLKQVPQSLGDLEKNLASSGTNLAQLREDAAKLAASLRQVQSDTAQLVEVIEQYELQVKSFQATTRKVRENIAPIVWGVVLCITFILFWLGATMVQTLWTGLAWMGIRPNW